MKSLIFIGVFTIIFSISSCKQIKEKSKEKIPVDTLDNTMNTDSSLYNNINKTAFQIFIDDYVDSINNAKTADQLPVFLKSPDFDYRNTGIFTPFHQPMPLRSLIINKVNNCNALKFILLDKSNIYKTKPSKNIDYVKDSNFSNYDLVKRKYLKLHCK